MILVRVGYLHESGMIHSYPFCTGDYSNTTIDVDLLVSYIDAVTKKHDIKKMSDLKICIFTGEDIDQFKDEIEEFKRIKNL